MASSPNSKKVETCIMSLPDEVILQEILPRLPAKAVIRFGCINKQYYKSIEKNDQFLSLHSKNSRKNSVLLFRFVFPWSRVRDAGNHYYRLVNDGFQRLVSFKSNYQRDVIGFSNGLVCFHIGSHGLVEVCNPTRREILAYHSPVIAPSIKFYGFGFDSVDKYYKIVCVCENKYLVLRIGAANESWIAFTGSLDYLASERHGLFSSQSNALFWELRSRNEILMFDLQHEVFRLISCPSECLLDHKFAVEYKGYMSLVKLGIGGIKSPGKLPSVANIYVLKTNAAEQVWEEEIVDLPFSPPSTVRVIGFLDKIIIHWFESDKKIFRIYNVHSKENKSIVRTAAFDRTNYDLICHIENIHSLKNFVKEPNLWKGLDFYPPLECILRHRPKTLGLLSFFCSFARNPEPTLTLDELIITL